MSEYGTLPTFVIASAVEVPETAWPKYVVLFHALYAVIPESVPQTMEPEASVSRACEHEAIVGIFTPPVSAVIPAKVEVAEAPIDVTETP